MVIGGWAEFEWRDEIELISPDPMIVIPDCLKNHEPFSYGTIDGGAGGLDAGKLVQLTFQSIHFDSNQFSIHRWSSAYMWWMRSTCRLP